MTNPLHLIALQQKFKSKRRLIFGDIFRMEKFKRQGSIFTIRIPDFRVSL